MPLLRRLTTALLPLPLLLGGLAACSEEEAPDQAEGPMATALQPGAPGEDNTVVTTVDEEAVMGEVTEADVAFVQDMVVHHAQALTMVDLVEVELPDPQVSAIADRIRAAQAPEVTTMATWLAQKGLPVPQQAEVAGVDLAELGAEPMAGHDMPSGEMAHPTGEAMADMPGMASPQELRALDAASGTDAGQMFLELMIAHHEGALTMATAQATDGGDVRISELADEMFVEQQAEIGRMRELQHSLPG